MGTLREFELFRIVVRGVNIPLERQGAPAAELLFDWVEESYRTIAPKRLITELDGR